MTGYCTRVVCEECGRTISECACLGEKRTVYQLCRDCESTDPQVPPTPPALRQEEIR